MKAYKLLLAILPLFAVGCNPVESDTSSWDGKDFEFNVVDADVNGAGGAEDVKSQYLSSIVEKVSDVNIFVYKDGVLANDPSKGFQTFFAGKTSLKASKMFPDMYDTYNVLLCSNVGELNVNNFKTETAARNFRYTYSSYADFTQKGFPRANVYENFRPIDHIQEATLLVERLVTKYDITVYNDMDGMDFELTSMAVKQVAKTIQFFLEPDAEYNGSGAKSTNDIFENKNDGDSFTALEIKNNQGVVYAMENYQGQVFADDITPKERKKENLQRKIQGDYITYLEFHGKVAKDGEDGKEKVWANATFRYYFGGLNDDEEKYAFVPRNYNIALNIKLSDAEIMEEDPDWRVEQGDFMSLKWTDFEKDIHDTGVHSAKLVATGWSGDVTITSSQTYILLGTSGNPVRQSLTVALKADVPTTIYYSVKAPNGRGIITATNGTMTSKLGVNMDVYIFPADGVSIMKNFPATFRVTAPFDFTVGKEGSYISSVRVTASGKNADGLYYKDIEVSTTAPLTGLAPYGIEMDYYKGNNVVLTPTSTEAGYIERVPIRVYHEAIPIKLYYGSYSDSYMRFYSPNPIKAQFNFSYSSDRSDVSGVVTPNTVGGVFSGVTGKNGAIDKATIKLEVKPSWGVSFYMGDKAKNYAVYGPYTYQAPAVSDIHSYTEDYNCVICQGYRGSGSYTEENNHINEYLYSPLEAIIPTKSIRAGSFSSIAQHHWSIVEDGQPLYASTDGDYSRYFYLGGDNTNWIFGRNSSNKFVFTEYGFYLYDTSKGIGENTNYMVVFNGAGCHGCCEDIYDLSDPAFEECPFYFVNGCQVATSVVGETHHWNVNSQNACITVRGYAPGRDLNSTANSDPSFVFSNFITGESKNWIFVGWLNYWKGNGSEQYNDGTYHSKYYLIINGCSAWPGGSIAQKGCLQ